MHILFLVSMWLHILAATLWIGGMFFIVLVVVPWLRSAERANAGAFLRDTGLRFRNIGWACFGVLLVTGTFNLWARGVRVGDLARAEWLSSPYGTLVSMKIATFLTVVGVSAIHDFAVGPRATQAIIHDPRSAEATSMRRTASLLGRANALLALVLIAVAVMLVRGAPW